MSHAPLRARRARLAGTAAAGLTALGLVAAGSAAVAGPSVGTTGATGAAATGAATSVAAAPKRRERTTLSSVLRAQVGPKGIARHLDAFADVAAANDGNRASGLPGYRGSRNYVVRTLRKAGYDPEVQAFEFPFYRELAPATFAQTAPTAREYVAGTDFSTMTYSGSGNVTDAAVTPVDVLLGAGAGNTSGCEDEDFTGFTPGNVALIQRGSCPFGQKALNAQEAGAAGVVIFNSGAAGATDAFAGTLGAPGYTIPVVGTSYAIGQELAEATGPRVSLSASTESAIRTTWNVIAETRAGKRDEVVMAGAHLDSVTEGEGINDNGSGSAALLETAVQLAKFDNRRAQGRLALTNKVRFAWWGAEELGLLGSEDYVARLTPAEVDRIALYLNFDMVGSPNFVRFVYDGDNSTGTGAVGPAGSAAIERTFVRYFDKQGLESDPSPFNGRSDYGPFIAEGVDIPAGGLFTGAEGVKTEEQAAVYGGTAGEAYDSCYHQDCDDRGNVSRKAIDQMSDALAHAVASYARSTAVLAQDAPARTARRDARGVEAAHLAAEHAEEHGGHNHGAPGTGDAPDHAHGGEPS